MNKGFRGVTPEQHLRARFAETAVEKWARRCGHGVIRHHSIEGDGAPAVVYEDGRETLMDLMIVGQNWAALHEVKGKTSWAKFMIEGRESHGIDLPHWESYLSISRKTGLPGFLSIVELFDRPGPDGRFAPRHLMQSLVRLLEWGPQTKREPHGPFKKGAVYWNRSAFDDWGLIPIEDGAPYLVVKDGRPYIPPGRVVTNPWEKRSKLPSEPQFDLFRKIGDSRKG